MEHLLSSTMYQMECGRKLDGAKVRKERELVCLEEDDNDINGAW